HVLDADGTLILAGAARRALPELFLAQNGAEFCVAIAGEQGELCPKYQLLRVQLLAGAKRRTIHLTSSTLDARERVENRLLRQILHGLEADFFFLEIEIRHASELDRFQKHRDGR